jgi:hypothetical protein
VPRWCYAAGGAAAGAGAVSGGKAPKAAVIFQQIHEALAKQVWGPPEGDSF